MLELYEFCICIWTMEKEEEVRAWLAKEKAVRKAKEDREAVIQTSPFGTRGEASYFCARRPKTTVRHTAETVRADSTLKTVIERHSYNCSKGETIQ